MGDSRQLEPMAAIEEALQLHDRGQLDVKGLATIMAAFGVRHAGGEAPDSIADFAEEIGILGDGSLGDMTSESSASSGRRRRGRGNGRQRSHARV